MGDDKWEKRRRKLDECESDQNGAKWTPILPNGRSNEGYNISTKAGRRKLADEASRDRVKPEKYAW